MSAKRVAVRPPAGLGAAGKQLWKTVQADLLPDWTFDSRELALLERACTTADAIAELDAVVAVEGVTTLGSRRQVIVHPALSEARQQKLVLLRLLQALDIGLEPAEVSPASARARRAAGARWAARDRFAQIRATGPARRLTVSDPREEVA